MAIKTIQIVQDDIDGSDDARTIPFSYDGLAYEIDLNDSHAEEFQQAIMPWIERARRARGSRGASARRASMSSPSPLRGRSTSLTEKGLSAKEIRAWAVANGVEVNEQGRIPESVIEQFEAAQKSGQEKPKRPARKTAAKKAPAKKAASRRRPAKKETAEELVSS